MFKLNTTFIITILFIALVYNVNSEVFTALTHMEHLLDVENNLIRNLNGFILNQEYKLNYIQQYSVTDKINQIINTTFIKHRN